LVRNRIAGRGPDHSYWPIVARLRESERDFERLKELALEAIARIY
jgi:hypothetical protein